MKIEFDPEVDALYVQLADGDVDVETIEEIKSSVMLDYVVRIISLALKR